LKPDPTLHLADPDDAGAPDPEAQESDQSLALRARTERDAFGVLYQRHVAAIYRYVYYRVGNAEDAEDLTAKSFARALNKINSYSDRGLPFTAWLYRIAHNVVANHHRDNSRKPSLPLDDVDAFSAHPAFATHDDADHKIDDDRARAALLRAIRQLPSERQHLIVLKFVEHKQNNEIGQIMNRSEGAIKSLYHRTLSQLREIIDNEAANRAGSNRDTTP
jgi:RNA polymerase sigma-70 factor, ECF subfamily